MQPMTAVINGESFQIKAAGIATDILLLFANNGISLTLLRELPRRTNARRPTAQDCHTRPPRYIQRSSLAVCMLLKQLHVHTTVPAGVERQRQRDSVCRVRATSSNSASPTELARGQSDRI